MSVPDADAADRWELERALRASRSAMEIATAVGSDTDLPRILELIVTRARSLVEADTLLIWLLQGDRLLIAAVAGNATVPEDASIPPDTSTRGRGVAGGAVGPCGGSPANAYRSCRVRHLAGEQHPGVS